MEAVNAVPTVRPLTAMIKASYRVTDDEFLGPNQQQNNSSSLSAFNRLSPTSGRASPTTKLSSSKKAPLSSSSSRHRRRVPSDDDTSPGDRAAANDSAAGRLMPGVTSPLITPPASPDDIDRGVLYNETEREKRRETLKKHAEQVLDDERRLDDIRRQREKARAIEEQAKESARIAAMEAAALAHEAEALHRSQAAIASSPRQYHEQPEVAATLCEKYGASFLFGLNPSSSGHHPASGGYSAEGSRRTSEVLHYSAGGTPSAPSPKGQKQQAMSHIRGRSASSSLSTLPPIIPSPASRGGGGGGVSTSPPSALVADIAFHAAVKLRCLSEHPVSDPEGKEDVYGSQRSQQGENQGTKTANNKIPPAFTRAALYASVTTDPDLFVEWNS